MLDFRLFMYKNISMSDYFDPSNTELLKDFYSEAEMQVNILEQNILSLENDPSNAEAIDEIFRAAHTLKGGAATVAMNELAEFTHILEDVLDEIRSNNIEVDEEVINCLLKAIDVIKEMLDERIQGNIFSGNISDLKETLGQYLPKNSKHQDKIKKQKLEPTLILEENTDKKRTKDKLELSEYDILELRDIAGKSGKLIKVTVDFNEDNLMNTVGGIQVYAVVKNFGKILKTAPEFELLYEDNFFPVVDYYIASEAELKKIEQNCFIPEVTTKIQVTEISENVENEPAKQKKTKQIKKSKKEEKTTEIAKEDNEEEAAAAKKQKKMPDTKVSQKKTAGSVLRVDSKRIDDLLNLITETVINKATLNQINSLFTELLFEYQESNDSYKEDIQKYFENVPEYLSKYKNGDSLKDVQKSMMTELNILSGRYDKFTTSLKTIINIFKDTSQNFSRISSELQSGVMQIRMVCISQIFARFPRLVRDLSRQLNKNVKLHIEGEDTELDKSVIEDLLDPLIHCVRNSLDHGIEAPEQRTKAGKTPEGNIFLKASNEGNMIIIEISDDGKGIDIEVVRKKAIDKGLIHESKNLSDVEAFNLIFEPGFSTASRVTNVSGRGVGLDVVKKQILKLNGNVNVWSEKGEGTKLTIKLPLTLAIIQGLLVRVGDEVYAIPISSVIESLRVKQAEIQVIDNYEVFNLRDEVLSLIRLNRLFKIETNKEQKYSFIVVVGSSDKMVGILVDSLIGEEDVVIKPLKDRFTNTPGIAGATILGDGTIALIIDVNQLLDFGLKIENAKRKSREINV